MFAFFEKKSEHGDVYFHDPLLQMSYLERLTVRVLTNSWIVVYVVGTVILLLTDVEWTFWLGVLSALYLLDRFLHSSRPDEYLPALGGPYENLALYLSPRAKRAIVSAYNRATILGGGFFLNLGRALSEARSIEAMLARLEVDSKEFNSKLDAYLEKDLVSYKNRERLLSEAEQLVFAAFGDRGRKQRSIDSVDLFAALGRVDNEQAASLLRVFEITGEMLRGTAPFGKLAGRPSFFLGRDPNNSSGVVSYEALARRILKLEKKYGVYVVYDSVRTAVGYAEKYFPNHSPLDSVERLVREAVMYAFNKGDDIVRDENIAQAAKKMLSGTVGTSENLP